MFKAIRGTKDILPKESIYWRDIESKARQIFALYGYQEIRTPILEESRLFNRCLGTSSEVVQKQMFEIKWGRDTFVLRPEATASVVRAYIENNIDKTDGFAKVFYIGPMFRAERPQKGRLRQFHHLGIEAVGSSSTYLDVETISLAHHLLKEIGISGFKIKINSLGCTKDKQRLASTLKTKLKSKLSKLCENCQKRYDRNVFRILDCKEETCRQQVSKIDIQNDYLCTDCNQHFQAVLQGLNDLGVKVTITPSLVRGLDYYTRTVFEISHSELGSQDALGAGGRYDKLVKELNGPDIGAIGFALGIERLLLVKKEKKQDLKKKVVSIISLGEESQKESIKLLDSLRKNNIHADTDYQGKSLKAAMRRANDLMARFVIIIGENELKKKIVTLKDMESGQQKEVKFTDLIATLRESEITKC